ncbi:MAG: LysE family transporter [Methylococcales symbiont of Hymedesmia sp. n. MRB-2018]|nr:MAG: LysE family transporter [Methylococcales symbiont of Hymedesmia sp. n. MRB-2018]
MSIIDSIALVGIILALALVPSAGVALVVTRTATLGTANGIAVSLGIVLGDLVFILLAILGLSVVAETMGSLFMVVKYFGGAYLVWLGISLLRHKGRAALKYPHKKNKF